MVREPSQGEEQAAYNNGRAKEIEICANCPYKVGTSEEEKYNGI